MSGQGTAVPPLIPQNFDAQSGFVDLLKVDNMLVTDITTVNLVASGYVLGGTTVVPVGLVNGVSDGTMKTTAGVMTGAVSIATGSLTATGIVQGATLRDASVAPRFTTTAGVVSAVSVTATTGDVVATLGAVSAGTTVTAGTGVVATTGNITATTGTLSLSSAKAGTATLVGGVATVNTLVVLTASDRIFLSRRTSGGAAFGTPTVVISATGIAGVAAFTITSLTPADGTTTVATDVGVIDWHVINSAAFTQV